jgi:aryl-alcohol dehydrogenase-like predicted oxidoreductase
VVDVTSTDAPICANSRDVAKPMPVWLPAPVTNATRPLRSNAATGTQLLSSLTIDPSLTVPGDRTLEYEIAAQKNVVLHPLAIVERAPSHLVTRFPVDPGPAYLRGEYGERMNLHTLGKTGMKVSPLCLGAMMFGEWGNTDHDESVRIIHRALDAGINFIDTADVYSQGESEEIVAKALATVDRSQVVLATKVHAQMGSDPNAQGNSRRWIIAECEHSLRRLGTDYIDLYQIHRPDESTDIDETLGALSDLVHAGKVRYVGSSTFPAEQIVEAQWVAEKRGRECFRTEQPPYSILVRGVERSILPVALQYGMGIIPWSPLAGGWLSGKFGAGKENTSHRAARIPARYDLGLPGNQRKLEIVNELSTLANDAGLTLIEMSLAFVLEHPAVSSAIIGPRTMEQLESQLSAPSIRLEMGVLDRIDEIVPPGTNINNEDAGWSPSVLTNPRKRRRSRS